MANRRSTNAKRSTVDFVILSDESWLLMHEVADLTGEVNRLLLEASEAQSKFVRTKKYKTLMKRLTNKT